MEGLLFFVRHRGRNRDDGRFVGGSRDGLCREVNVMSEETGAEDRQRSEGQDQQMQARPVLPAESGAGRGPYSRGVSRLKPFPRLRSARAERASNALRLLLIGGAEASASMTAVAPPVLSYSSDFSELCKSFLSFSTIIDTNAASRCANVDPSPEHALRRVLSSNLLQTPADSPRGSRRTKDSCVDSTLKRIPHDVAGNGAAHTTGR